MDKKIVLSLILLTLVSTNSPAKADDPAVVEAQKLFKQYVDSEHNYDPSQAELYAPNANIKDVRVYSDGQSKTLSWTGDNYKQIVKAQLPVAKARGEQNTYSQVNYIREGNNVRIKCVRASVQKKFSAPMEIVVAPVGKVWKIVEENCQSQP
jgi:hypothetical protein